MGGMTITAVREYDDGRQIGVEATDGVRARAARVKVVNNRDEAVARATEMLRRWFDAVPA